MTRRLPIWLCGLLLLSSLAVTRGTASEITPISDRMRTAVSAPEISGAVTLVARHGKVVHLSAVGLADIDAKRPMQTDALFAVASMTKPITATALMMLQDAGQLSVEDPVSKYIPEFKQMMLASGPPQREMTIRDVLTHTSGLGGDQQCQGTLRETAEELVARKLSFEPGTKWQYSPGLNVAGRIIEVVSGMPFERFLQERLFDPLNMSDTTFVPTAAQQARLARLYQPSADKRSLVPGQHWIVDLSKSRAPNPSGGLFSTATDMARFYQMVLDGGQYEGRRIMSQSTVSQMTSIQTGDLVTGFTPGNGWGLGWCVIREPQGVTASLSPGTYGHGGAFGTQGWVDPRTKTIYVLMIQRVNFGNSDGSDLRGDFHQLAAEALRP
ncbi:MAG: serine hydrolase domain-containing protein [Pirellulaceae bacterium]